MNFFRHLWLACGGFRTYQTFLGLPLRSTICFWALLSFLLSLVAMANIIHWFKAECPAIARRIFSHVPEFNIANGQASSRLPQPFFANTNQFPIILDIDRSLAAPEKMFPAGVAVRQRDLLFWTQETKPVVMPWKQWPDGTINADYLDKLLKEITQTLPFMFPIVWLVILFAGLIESLFFTLLAAFLERSMNPSFTFGQLFNLALFAMTPGALTVAIYAAIGFYEVSFLLYFCGHCFFFVMASGACRVSLRPPEDIPPPLD
ncbi:MAG: DUF1189 family protein [Verrucomicrobia bacterium]|nr:DUF1189 family protein [Verrucomicrobiota bacterium]